MDLLYKSQKYRQNVSLHISLIKDLKRVVRVEAIYGLRVKIPR